MKIKQFFTLLLLSIVVFSCNVKEDVDSVSNDVSGPAFTGSPSIIAPNTPCGGATSTSLVDMTGAGYANVQIMNDDQFVYVMITANGNWVLTDFFLNAGDHNLVPQDAMGNMMKEGFSFNDSGVDRFPQYTFYFDASTLGNCPDLIVSAEVKQMDFMGNTTNPKRVWLNGTNHLDGKYLSYCKNVCPAGAPEPIPSTL